MGLTNILPLHKKDTTSQNGTQNGSNATTDRPAKKHRIPNRWRNELVAAAAEFSGTFMFLFFAFGGTSVANTAAAFSDAATAGQDNNSITQAPNTSVLLYISLVFGFSLMVNVWVFFRVSGGLFNPAVSLQFPLRGLERY
jgi:aquaporin related protein